MYASGRGRCCRKDRVKADSDVAAQLQVLLLVQTNRNQVGLIQQDVGSHQGRIGEQTGVDIIGVFSGFVLELGHTGQLAELGVAVEYPCQLCVGLNGSG